MKYLQKSEGAWNLPHVRSNTLSLNVWGFAPKFRGGCIAIIPHEKSFVMFSEDDDSYTEKCVLTHQNLSSLADLYKELDIEVSVKTDFVKAKSYTTYLNGKGVFYDTNFSQGGFIVKVEDRLEHAPLVNIEGNGYKEQFDIGHIKSRLACCRKALAAEFHEKLEHDKKARKR
jgi:hypothetical protein